MLMFFPLFVYRTKPCGRNPLGTAGYGTGGASFWGYFVQSRRWWSIPPFEWYPGMNCTWTSCTIPTGGSKPVPPVTPPNLSFTRDAICFLNVSWDIMDKHILFRQGSADQSLKWGISTSIGRCLPILTFSDRLSTYPEGCFQRLTFETAVRHGATFGMERKSECPGLGWHGLSNFKYYVLNIFLDICGILNIRVRDPDPALFGNSWSGSVLNGYRSWPQPRFLFY